VRRILVGTVCVASALLGSDISGTWIGHMPGRNGETKDIAFQFAQKGATLGGKMYGDYQSTPISEGTVSGDLVTFIVNTQEQTGNQINETRIRFTGRLKDGEMELFREREASTNAGNGGAVQVKGNAKQTCRLKRLP
jgi:hypothetical protein